MKKLIVNLVAILVISIGGYSLLQPQSIQAQPIIKTLTKVSESCGYGDATITGDCCTPVDDGARCFCYDKKNGHC